MVKNNSVIKPNVARSVGTKSLITKQHQTIIFELTHQNKSIDPLSAKFSHYVRTCPPNTTSNLVTRMRSTEQPASMMHQCLSHVTSHKIHHLPSVSSDITHIPFHYIKTYKKTERERLSLQPLHYFGIYTFVTRTDLNY